MCSRNLGLLSCLTIAAWGQRPVISPGGVVNSASYATTRNTYLSIGHGISPTSIVSIFGSELAHSTEIATSVPLTTQLAGTTVTVNGRPAPLFYVSPSQINFQVPAVDAKGPASIQISTATGTSEPYMLDLVGSTGIFSASGSGCGQGAVLNVKGDGSVSMNSEQNSASPGDYISIYGTGLTDIYNAPPSGVPTQMNPPATASIGASPYFDFALDNAPGPLAWSGLAPGLVAVDQFNFQVPDNSREGCGVPLQIASTYGISQPVTISIHKGGGPCLDPPSAGYGQITWEKTVVVSPSENSSETENVTISLQASPEKQIPQRSTNQRQWDYFGPACPLPGYRSLDAGSVALRGPGFGPLQANVGPLQGGPVSELTEYLAVLPAGTIQSGSFNVRAGGGVDVGAFDSTLRIGSEIHVTTNLAGRSYSEGDPVVVNWTGGDPDSQVTVRIVSHLGYVDEAFSSEPVPASAGTITLNPINHISFGIGGPDIEILVEVTPDPAQIPAILAAGLSLGGQHTWKYTYRFGGISMENP